MQLFLFLIILSSSLQIFASEPPALSNAIQHRRYHKTFENNKSHTDTSAEELLATYSALNALGKTIFQSSDAAKESEKKNEAVVEQTSAVEKTNKVEKEKDPQQQSSHNFIYDAYTQRRGTPKMLEIICRSCTAPIMDYQKDGPGRLLRCYLDRIHRPSRLHDRQYERFSVAHSPNLQCPRCHTNVGYPMIYKSEHRPAYDMNQSRFSFKVLPN